jgi:enoyl-CoA hydratase
MSDGVRIEVRERIAYLTIDRQDRRNALDRSTMQVMIEAVDRFDQDEDVWLVVITGSGESAFCAGRDLKELAADDARSPGHLRPMRGTTRNLFEVIYECRKPTIAAVNGWAVGGGLELAMACDLRVAAEHARLGLTEAKRGNGANFGCAILPRLVPLGIAYEMLYLGETLTAGEAERWGLVNRVFSSETFREETEAFIRSVLERAPLTQRRAKAVLQKGAGLPLQAALRLDPAPDAYSSADRIEGVNAFLEKRAPVWRAR